MATKHPTSHLTFLGDPYSGRDEMNLAGHPFALLKTPKRQSETSIFYEWQRTLADGRAVTASWRVETSAAYGLPGPEEELVYLVLLQITREAAETAGTPGEWPMTVQFSRIDLLQRLGWHRNAQYYSALSTAFARLKSVSIVARHAFYDARSGKPADEVGFGILDAFSLICEPNGRKNRGNVPLSHFEWNTIMHTSLVAGNVRSLALDFVISLKYSTSCSLFRLLDGLRHSKKPPLPQISMTLTMLCNRIGMTQYPYASQIVQKLAPAVQELKERGYLEGMSVEKTKAGEPMAVFRFADAFKPEKALAEPKPAPQPTSQPAPATPAQDAAAPARTLTLPDGPFQPHPDDEQERRNTALDEIFEALDEQERAEIEKIAYDGLMPFLQENPRRSSARGETLRKRRCEVAARYAQSLGERLL